MKRTPILAWLMGGAIAPFCSSFILAQSINLPILADGDYYLHAPPNETWKFPDNLLIRKTGNIITGIDDGYLDTGISYRYCFQGMLNANAITNITKAAYILRPPPHWSFYPETYLIDLGKFEELSTYNPKEMGDFLRDNSASRIHSDFQKCLKIFHQRKNGESTIFCTENRGECQI